MGRVTTSSEYLPYNASTLADGNGTTYNMSYNYDLADELTSFTYPSGRVVNTVYDHAARISRLSDVYNGATSNHASSVTYFPNRVIEAVTLGHPNLLGNAMTENTGLNSRLQISSRNVQLGSVDPVQFGFTYGSSGHNSGNLTQQTIQTIAAPNPPPGVSVPALNLTQNYGYDAYDRLLSAAESGGSSEWTQNYLYDQWGNRAVQSGSYIPNPNGTPTATSQFTNNRWTSASYDAAGDATSIPGTSTTALTYDAENRVATANAGGTGTITYVYDGEGRRVQKVTSPSTFATNYIYDAFGKVIQESTIPTAGTSFPTEPPYNGTEYLIADHLGSMRLSLDNEGQVVKRYDFLPFGEELTAGVGGRGGGLRGIGLCVSYNSGRGVAKVHRQRTGFRDGPRLFRGQVFLVGAGPVHQCGLVGFAGSGSLCDSK